MIRFLLIILTIFQFCSSQETTKTDTIPKDSTWVSSLPIKKEFDHKTQVINAGSMMAAFAIMLFTINNFNPQ